MSNTGEGEVQSRKLKLKTQGRAVRVIVGSIVIVSMRRGERVWHAPVRTLSANTLHVP